MKKINLVIDQIQELVAKNKYKVNENNKFLSRCIDGRYLTSNNLPPLATPGADAGELALVLATGNVYGFTVDVGKSFDLLTELVGGIKNINFHTDEHGDKKIVLSGCGHIKQMRLDPEAYNLEENQLKGLTKILTKAGKKGAKETVLQGEHLEAAIIQIKGNYSIYPRFLLETDEEKNEVEVFVYQSTLVDKRHRELAKKLIENKAVELFPGCDEEYLFEILSETTENHLIETAKRLAKGLPVYEINFSDDGSFTIEEMGKV